MFYGDTWVAADWSTFSVVDGLNKRLKYVRGYNVCSAMFSWWCMSFIAT